MCSLLEGNRQIYQDIHFRDSKLVVDGKNLGHLLYRMATLDQNNDGEYLAFQALIQAFFKTQDNCQIKPYVVIDIKRNPRMDHRKTFHHKTTALLKGRKMGIYPPLIMEVFEQTLSDMEVPLVRCFGEADGQLAALAREWCCPVLSTDTDFCIYDLPEGGFYPRITPGGARWRRVVASPASGTPRLASAPSSTSIVSCCPSSPHWPGTTTLTSKLTGTNCFQWTALGRG